VSQTTTQVAYLVMPTPAAVRDEGPRRYISSAFTLFKSVLNYKHHLPLHHGTLHFVHRVYLRIPYIILRTYSDYSPEHH
jgi:hypothetical protein